MNNQEACGTKSKETLMSVLSKLQDGVGELRRLSEFADGLVEKMNRNTGSKTGEKDIPTKQPVNENIIDLFNRVSLNIDVYIQEIGSKIDRVSNMIE